ncbi:hypothetical protein QBC33DRAFT_543333 [Phialemonium atrogriseum]|uniref:Uncharacterized protein n=1 Tax=Phialemonium atrogriseum TaxID=1093897 RepID=A0AAJ0BW78_9PEZI|nr:uncharacterized protein QBC33DRAFT_543333 [Phialemonium atrogriseum]KAK1765605.1 hypothetical protein QBC33DRAFT_543333 [Phialemonium atrogriseum]
MCRKTIYYNTYGDGAEDVTERVDTCRPGKMCSYPDLREYNRNFRFTKLQELSNPGPSSQADRLPTPYAADYHLNVLPPTPRRSKSPSPSRRRESGVFVNGAKIADVTGRKRHTTAAGPGSRDRVVVVPHAPEPPSPRPTLKRSGTMPEFDARAGQLQRRNSSREIPLGPVHILEGLASRRPSTRTTRDHHHQERRSRSPYIEEDREEREERRRRRAERRASTVYVSGGSDYSSSAPATSAASQQRKELRWKDQVDAEIAAQNQRIARRPKVRLHVHQDQEAPAKKGILKREATAAGDGAYEELRSAVERMGIQGGGGAGREEKRYWDRLRDRFEEPRERRRRSRVYYPGEGTYKYM